MRETAIALVYVVGAFWTFGHIFNEKWCGSITMNVAEHGATVRMTRQCLNPIAAGVVWPVYWTGRAAIYLTGD